MLWCFDRTDWSHRWSYRPFPSAATAIRDQGLVLPLALTSKPIVKTYVILDQIVSLLWRNIFLKFDVFMLFYATITLKHRVPIIPKVSKVTKKYKVPISIINLINRKILSYYWDPQTLIYRSDNDTTIISMIPVSNLQNFLIIRSWCFKEFEQIYLDLVLRSTVNTFSENIAFIINWHIIHHNSNPIDTIVLNNTKRWITPLGHYW